ncbi:MAG: Mobilization protein mobB [Ferrovum myxofaciens]|uniref:plasmid mobilization protein n=2 Tax=Ferrovum myxofaciens TaxID=416213 RepID=UPI002356CC87|nr:hypothetical protein [Ferrovum myxofaciens]QKE39961.1 MAG: Mobilization protein mobB [Ferrovum myxofaciens]
MNKPKPKMNSIAFVRLTEEQKQDLGNQANSAGMTLSELIRNRALNQPVPSHTDAINGKKIDQLGRMLRHLYPKGKSWASAEDRKLYWKTIVELQRTSKMLRGEK